MTLDIPRHLDQHPILGLTGRKGEYNLIVFHLFHLKSMDQMFGAKNSQMDSSFVEGLIRDKFTSKDKAYRVVI